MAIPAIINGKKVFRIFIFNLLLPRVWFYGDFLFDRQILCCVGTNFTLDFSMLNDRILRSGIPTFWIVFYHF
jgi:hypothetical protein